MNVRCAMILACVGGLTAAQGHAQGQDKTKPNAQKSQLVEIPGEMEFSGRLIAMPLQVSALVESGMAPQQAAAQLQQAEALLSTFAVHTTEPLVGYTVINLPQGESENQVIDRLMATGLFKYVEPDWTVYPLDCPNDSQFGSQWHHNENRMDSCAGWDIYVGDPSISVGICDTGIETSHPDLQLNRLEAYNAVDQVWENDGGNITPVHPHGTQVTGCSAANGNNGIGVSGVGQNLSHRMMRVSNSSGGGSNLSVLNHASLVSIQAGDKVANVSYSGVTAQSIRDTATAIKGLGGLVCWAAGNNAANLNWGNRDDDDLIVVGSTDINDNKAGSSAFGNSVDVTAPGASVFTSTTGGGYTNVSGTSFASPMVAGLCALIWSANPSLTPDEVEAALKAGVDDLGAAGPDTTYGHGRINVFGSMDIVGVPPMQIELPDGTPEFVDPDGGTTIPVTIIANGISITGTPSVFYDDGNGEQSAQLTALGGDNYELTMPAVECLSTVNYYISVMGSDGETYTSPRGAPATSHSSFATNGTDITLEDNFETDNGWTVSNENLTDGAWERGVPAGDGDRWDPLTDADGSGSCWLTDNVAGNSDVDGGTTRLMSPMFDMSGMTGAQVGYSRWFNSNNPVGDTFIAEVSNNDGSSWTQIESGASGDEWVDVSFAVEDFVSLTTMMRFRFSVTDGGLATVVEGGFDHFLLFNYTCSGCPLDLNSDTVVDFFDVTEFLNLFSSQDPRADWNDDTVFDFFDVQNFLADFAAGC